MDEESKAREEGEELARLIEDMVRDGLSGEQVVALIDRRIETKLGEVVRQLQFKAGQVASGRV